MSAAPACLIASISLPTTVMKSCKLDLLGRMVKKGAYPAGVASAMICCNTLRPLMTAFGREMLRIDAHAKLRVCRMSAHHEAIQSIHLPYKCALRQAPNAGVAAHLPNAGCWRWGHQQRLSAPSGSGSSCFAACRQPVVSARSLASKAKVVTRATGHLARLGGAEGILPERGSGMAGLLKAHLHDHRPLQGHPRPESQPGQQFAAVACRASAAGSHWYGSPRADEFLL